MEEKKIIRCWTKNKLSSLSFITPIEWSKNVSIKKIVSCTKSLPQHRIGFFSLPNATKNGKDLHQRIKDNNRIFKATFCISGLKLSRMSNARAML